METEADDLCVCVRVCVCVCVCVEPSVNKATTVHLSGKTDDIPASISPVPQLLIAEKCMLSMQ